MRFRYDTSYRQSGRLLRGPREWLPYAALVAVLAVLPWVLPSYYIDEATYLFILAIASLGLMIVTGYTGQVSLGHAAFLAIGAYAHAWFLSHGVPLVASLALAALLAGACGFVIGLPAIRVSGLYLAMVTLAFASIVEQVVGNWKAVTGGYSGTAVPSPSLFGIDLSSSTRLYGLCLVILVLVLVALVNLMRSKTGRAFAGIRQSEAAANALGIWVAGYKVLAFVISAAITGLAGGLLAHQLQFLTPDGFTVVQSIELLLMVVIGGLGSLRGAIFGAIVIGLLPTFISGIKPMLPPKIAAQFGLDIFVYGAILGFFVLFEPLGLNGRWRRAKAALAEFPLHRAQRHRRVKSYMKSERYR
ncbi:MAG TPA: branched-chain amino acid ABC transporter permease [Hyphomicrobiales bacterium]|nr:branched-chain amino acid ABC transporter permease [Hyphomicrobiales bacterium]